MYYPENDCPYYRATVFSHYAIRNVPSADVLLPTLYLADGTIVADTLYSGPYWSLMLEISESKFKPVNMDTILRVWPYYLLITQLITLGYSRWNDKYKSG